MTIGFLIPLSIGMGLAGLCAFVWALSDGQFDDPEGDSRRILIPRPPKHGDDNVRLVAQPDHEDPRRGL